LKKKLNTAKRDFEGAATWNTGGGVDPAAAQAAVQTMVATGKAGNEDTRFGRRVAGVGRSRSHGPAAAQRPKPKSSR